MFTRFEAMASSNVSRTLLKSVKGRSFGAAAAAQADRGHGDKGQCSVKKLSNGILLGVAPSNSPVSRLAVVVNNGPRFENGSNLGVSHLVRHSAKLRTQFMTDFALTRSTQDLGSDISIVGTREYIYFKSNVARNFVPDMVNLLQEVTTRPSFRDWEMADLQKDKNGMLLDLALYQTRPHIRAVELLHSAAFRNTLGNSLYAPDHMVGKYTPHMVQDFVSTHQTVGRMALVGLGVDPVELEELGSTFKIQSTSGETPEKATYHGGGEIRQHTGGEISFVAVGFGGPSLTSKDLLASEVLRHIMGSGPHVKYSGGASGAALTKAVDAATNAPCNVSCINATYTDNGLFGFTAVAHASEIRKVTQAVSKSLASVNISEQDVARGKNLLKADICMQFEDPDVLLTWLGEQALNGDGVVSPDEIYKMVDAVNTNDVKNVAKSIFSTKPSMGSAGNLTDVPYLDELFS